MDYRNAINELKGLKNQAASKQCYLMKQTNGLSAIEKELPWVVKEHEIIVDLLCGYNYKLMNSNLDEAVSSLSRLELSNRKKDWKK